MEASLNSDPDQQISTFPLPCAETVLRYGQHTEPVLGQEELDGVTCASAGIYAKLNDKDRKSQRDSTTLPANLPYV